MRQLFILAVLVVLVAVPGTVDAAATPVGLTVTPAIEQLSLPSGDRPVTVVTQLSNDTAQARTLAVSAQDFTYLNQDGAIRFVSPETAMTGAHGLAAAIVFDNELIHLAPGQTVQVRFQIVHPDQLAPGGHYAAILYREVDSTSSHGINIDLKPAVTTLLFATTAGQGSVGLKLATPILSGITTNLPASLDVVFANTGSAQTSVHGLVRIVAPGGQLMAQGIINVDSGLILPAAERLFTVGLGSQSSRPWWPGTYELQVLYRRDGQTNYDRYTQTFLYVDGRLLAILGLAFVTGLIVILRRVGPGNLYLLRR